MKTHSFLSFATILLSAGMLLMPAGLLAQQRTITGTVTDDNSTLLKAVEDSVDSFTVLKDEELKNVTALTTVAGTPATGETTAPPPCACAS